MRDEESGNTPTVNLLGAVRPKVKDAGERKDSEALAGDLEDDDDLVPAVRSFAVPSSPSPHPVPRPPSPHEEMTVHREAELRARATQRPPAPKPAWARGVGWMLASAVVGGALMFVGMKLHARATGREPVEVSATPVATSIPTPTVTAMPAPTSPPTLASAPTSTPTSPPTPISTPSASETVTAPDAVQISPMASVDLLAAAAQARHQGNPARARGIYRTILGKAPDDIDALMGLAELARADGRSSDARAFYEHALIVNPNHGPAILGLADTLWDLDEKDAARARYRDLLRRAPASSYPPRVENRAPP